MKLYFIQTSFKLHSTIVFSTDTLIVIALVERLVEDRNFVPLPYHRLLTPKEGINQRILKIRANVADKICFGRTKN